MDVISRSATTSSNLNPNAPMFVPLAYRTVEDFSAEWWALVQSSPWFQDYWLQERFQDPQNDPSFSDIHDPALLSDVDALFDDVENIHYSPSTQSKHF